jgi:hypothetical protein
MAFPRDGILADDPGDRADITGRVRAVFDCVFGAEADRLWAEAAQILGSNGDLRPWLSRSLFDDTIRRYSKSRRKAPIYWQLATPSASYSVWLYYHRMTKDTFYSVLSDHMDPKLQHEERRLSSLLAEAGVSPNAAERRQIAEQEAFVEEIRAFREEIARTAPLWNPNHDDGVIINFAPLWRLVPQHRGLAARVQGVLGQTGGVRLRVVAPRHASLARARRAEVRRRTEPCHRPRARGRVLVRGCERQMGEARGAGPTR